ncbi:MAG: hypothetical protein K1X57_10320 [Gemmataceae bacterium]|nr:hypothetical protein [Gemmataceae bacterium]
MTLLFFDLHRLYGDATGDRQVDAADFLAFRLAYLGVNLATYDYDGDGVVNSNDFLQFRTRFLTVFV